MSRITRPVYIDTHCYVWTRRDGQSSRAELMIEPDGEVYALDPVSDCWTTVHALNAESQMTARRMAENACARRRTGGGTMGYMTWGDIHHTYAVVCFGAPTQDHRGVYGTLERAREAARRTRGGTCSDVQILGCESPEQAATATIHDELPRVS